MKAKPVKTSRSVILELLEDPNINAAIIRNELLKTADSTIKEIENNRSRYDRSFISPDYYIMQMKLYIKHLGYETDTDTIKTKEE